MSRPIQLAFILSSFFCQGDCGLSLSFLGLRVLSSDVLCFVGDFRLSHILFDSTTRQFHLPIPLLSLLQKTAFFDLGYISGPVLIHPVIGAQRRVY